ncbi:MAG TPA: tetratricopeptide repeat protein [Roseiarcus sp.]
MPNALQTTRAAANEGQRGANALYAAAVGLWREQQRDDAIKLMDEALRLRPDFADALCMGGYMLSECGKPDSAMRFYRRALELDASLVVAHVNSGKLLFGTGRFTEALDSFAAATRLAPHDSDAWCSRAGTLRELGRLEESVDAAERALELRRDFPEAAINLGNALLKLDRSEKALEAYLRASEPGPCLAKALLGQGLALRSLGRFSEAMTAFDKVAALGSREAVAAKGCLMLTLGDFEQGFEGYEARWLKGRSLSEALGIRFETWKGPGRRGERVLVLNDHGLGDTIQFFRYLPLMAAAGVEATFVCPPRLRRLLSSKAKVRFADSPPDGEPFDAQIAISSLPWAFGTRLETIPAAVPYLSAEPALREIWRKRIGAEGFKVGVVWQGNPNPEADRARSMPLASLAPLSGIAGVRLISLQKGAGEEQLSNLPASMLGRDAGRRLRRRRRRLRRYGSGDDLPRSRCHVRHLDRASRRSTGCSGLGRAQERCRMALANQTGRYAMVSNHAPLSSDPSRRLERRVRGHGERAHPACRAAHDAAHGLDSKLARRTDR